MIIKTVNHNYFYDNDIGLLVPNANIISAILNIENWHNLKKEVIINRLNNKFSISKISFYYDWLFKIKKFKESNIYDGFISCDDIQMLKEYLLKFGFKQLILSVTEDCNFRCSYCTYSSDFSSFRNHSNNYMTLDTAKKAIDIYFEYVVNGEKFNLFRQPTIGFYGGEPLLNYRLIKKSVNYIKKIYGEEVIFTISTNGSLLNKSIMDFLIDNNFSITISFDGNSYEQNRKRKFKNYENSFGIVYKNIMNLIDCGYDSVYVHPVFDFKTNLKECNSFFSKNNIKVISISDVDDIFTKKYYDKFTHEDYELFNKNLLKIRDNYSPNSFYSYFYHLFEDPCVNFFLNSKMCNNLHIFNKFSDSCIPEKNYLLIQMEHFICVNVFLKLSLLEMLRKVLILIVF